MIQIQAIAALPNLPAMMAYRTETKLVLTVAVLTAQLVRPVMMAFKTVRKLV